MTYDPRAPFERRLLLGTMDTGYKRRAEVRADIKWDGTRLSIMADAKRPGAPDTDAGGQMQDTIRQELAAGTFTVSASMTAEKIGTLLDVWDRWHLNDMRAGCEHQRAEGWGERPIDPEKPTHTYGRHFEGQQYDSWNLLGWVRPDEHPDGLMTKECPACGYRYGTAWLTEEVPTEALDRLRWL